MNRAPPIFRSYRWIVCLLLFAATTINYVDRQILGILAPTLSRDLGWSELEYSRIVLAFQAAYAIGFLGFGRIIDKIGTRLGLGIAVTVWSIAAVCHSAARNAIEFGVARFALGIGEAGNFPAAIRTTAEWFPKRERALATGIFNAGSNTGAILTPLIVPWLALNYGWRSAFFVTGFLGLFWLVFWFVFYQPLGGSKRVTLEERRYIESDAAPESGGDSGSLAAMLRDRSVLGIAAAKFLTDPIWWFYLYWIPKFLSGKFHLDLSTIGAPLVVIYLVSDIGSVGGGYLSSRWIRRGVEPILARKRAMLGCAVAVLPVIFIPWMESYWGTILVISLAAAAHQGWSANLFTTVSDLFPAGRVASVVGVAGTAGAIGGMCIATAAGYVLEYTGSYLALFCICGTSYLAALALLHRATARS